MGNSTLLFLLVFVCFSCNTDKESHKDTVLEKAVAINQSAIDFSLLSAEKTMVNLSDYKGNYLLVDFWASWCGPCLAEVPNLKKNYQKYHNKGFDILSVSTDKSEKSWLKTLSKLDMAWQQVRDVSGEVSTSYQIEFLPTVYLIDTNGIIIAKGLRGEKLDSALSILLND